MGYAFLTRRRWNSTLMKCSVCEDSGWVCETHPDKPWEGEHACRCDGAGMPCPKCNVPEKNEPPRPPAGLKTQFDKRGWRQ